MARSQSPALRAYSWDRRTGPVSKVSGQSEFDTAQGRFRRDALEQRKMTRSYGSAVDTLMFFRRRTTAAQGHRRPRLRIPPLSVKQIFRTRRIPSYLQSEASDCGPACL